MKRQRVGAVELAVEPPARAGRVALGPEDVIGPAAQGIAAGEFDELLRAIRDGRTYANVHSTKHPGGEIRGQIERGRED